MRLLYAIDDTREARHAAEVASSLSAALQAETTCVEATGTRPLRLAGLARADGCDLLVAGYRPRRSVLGVRLGATPEQIADRAGRATMLVGRRWKPPGARRVLLGYDPAQPTRPASTVAGRLAALLGASLLLVPTPADARAPRPTGWQLYDAARRAEQTARETAGASIEIELATRPSTPLSALATEMRPSFVVVDADAPCRAWQDSQAARLLEQEQWPVLVVPRDAPIPV